MPGIVGVIGSTGQGEGERVTSVMLSAMAREPFYCTGLYNEPTLGVHAGWTAHPGSYSARQSGRDLNGVVVVVSGECVADRTEPNIARLYDRVGDRVVADLNGLFSALLIDTRRRRILLFNDRFGMERLYVHKAKGRVYFASEAGALLRAIPEIRAFDEEGVAQFLAFGCTQNERTLFRNVELLPGGTVWQLAGPEAGPRRYFNPRSWESQPRLDHEGFQVALGDTLKTVLPRYLTSGGITGISLTGGLDTRMIMACLPALEDPIVCYTFSLEGQRTLDERIAADVAALCGLQYRTIRVGSDFFSNFGEYVDRTVLASDGYAGATTAHEICLNAQARLLGRIRLTGNFGSEVLRGMSTFKPIALSPALLAPDMASIVEAFARTTRAPGHAVALAAFRNIPWGLFGGVAAARSQVTLRTPYLDNDVVALAFRAPIRSLQTADAALGVVRDYRPALARLATDRGLRVSDGRLKRLLRGMESGVSFKLDYLYSEGLPSWLLPFDGVMHFLARNKWLGSHKYLRYRVWFQRELAGHVSEVLSDSRAIQMPFWRGRTAIESILRGHLSGRANYVQEISMLLSFEAMSRLLLTTPIGPEPATPTATFSECLAPHL